jgi:hypothetical protein
MPGNRYLRIPFGRPDGSAQFTALDIVLFAVIITISSSVLVNAVLTPGINGTGAQDDPLRQRAEDALQVLLRTTINTDELFTPDNSEWLIQGGWRPLSEVISEHLVIISGESSNSDPIGMPLEILIRTILVNLTAPYQGFISKAEYGNNIIEVDNNKFPERDIIYAEVEHMVSPNGRKGAVLFSLGLWRL